MQWPCLKSSHLILHNLHFHIYSNYNLPPLQSYPQMVCTQLTISQTSLFHSSTHHCWHCTSSATRPAARQGRKVPLTNAIIKATHFRCCPLDRNSASRCYVITFFSYIARHSKISNLAWEKKGAMFALALATVKWLHNTEILALTLQLLAPSSKTFLAARSLWTNPFWER